MDNDVYLGEMGRREQGKFFQVLIFFYRIRFFETRSRIRRSNIGYFLQVFFFIFYMLEIDVQKYEVIYDSDKFTGKRDQDLCFLVFWFGVFVIQKEKRWDGDFYEYKENLVNFFRLLCVYKVLQ